MYQYAIHARRSGSLHKQFSWERIITAYLGNQWRTPLSSTPEGDLCVGIDTTTQALQLRYIPGIYTHDGFPMLCLSLLTHPQLNKWPLFRRRWFQIWFYEWKCFVFGSQFYLSLLLSCYLQSVIPEHTDWVRSPTRKIALRWIHVWCEQHWLWQRHHMASRNHHGYCISHPIRVIHMLWHWGLVIYISTTQDKQHKTDGVCNFWDKVDAGSTNEN